MAEETSTDDFPSTDEFDELIPTQEELEAQRAKTEQALALGQAMKQEELSLAPESALRAAGAPAVAAPGVSGAAYEFGRGIGVLPLQTPTNAGRSYMGPALTPEQEARFMQTRPGTRINLAPPPPLPGSPESQAAAHRIALATKPPPDMNMTGEQFAAQEGYRRAVSSGIPSDVAARLYLPPLLKGQMATTITPYQQLSLAQRGEAMQERKRQFDALHPPTETGTMPAPVKTDIGGGWSVVQVPGTKAWRMVNSQTGQSKPFTPSEASRLYQQITQAERFGRQTNSPMSALKPELLRIIQSGAGITNAPAAVAKPAAAAATGERVRVKNPQGKIGTIPASQLKEALANGWTQM